MVVRVVLLQALLDSSDGIERQPRREAALSLNALLRNAAREILVVHLVNIPPLRSEHGHPRLLEGVPHESGGSRLEGLAAQGVCWLVHRSLRTADKSDVRQFGGNGGRASRVATASGCGPAP